MHPKPRLQKSRTKVYAFGQTKPLNIKGNYTCTIESGSKFVTATVYVIPGNTDSIIGYNTAVELGIIPVIRSVSENNYENLCNKYSRVFQGLGKLKDREIKFHVDENVVPVAQSQRRVPFHVRDQIEKELERLEKMDVIEKVDGPKLWVSNLVIAPKPNAPDEVWLCVDMRKANEAIKRERHVTPKIDDIILDQQSFQRLTLSKDFTS